jgi:glutaredoxin-like protein NrdH
MITVYTKPGCGTCDATKVWLNRNKIDYLQVDIEHDAAARAFVEQLGYTQMPVVVAGSEHWSGFRVEKLAALRARRG